MTAIEKLIRIAKEENGYLEKKSNKDLDSKTGNAGSNNYTKYARDLYPSLQGQAWCDMYVDWCFVKAFGQVTA
ncbi:CHAP domain-containing protein, partial [bacterium D16-54]